MWVPFWVWCETIGHCYRCMRCCDKVPVDRSQSSSITWRVEGLAAEMVRPEVPVSGGDMNRPNV